MIIKNRLWELMAIHHESNEQVVKDTGLSRNSISNIKRNDKANISIHTLEILCEHYKIQPGEFFKTDSSNVNVVLGQRIKKIRVSRKETLEEFANAIQKNADKTIKTTKSNVSKWEKGLNIPNDIALFSIAQLGNMSRDELIRGL